MLEVLRFECRYQLRSPLFLAISIAWFLLAFLIMASESVSVGGLADNLNLNASYTIIAVQYVLTIIGMFAAVAFVAGAINRDIELRTAELLFASGVSETSYLFGRFVGGALFATLAVLAGTLGSFAGTLMPWLPDARMGPISAAPYLYSVVAVVLPNMFVICALFFTVSALTRSMMAAYLAALGLLVGFAVVANNVDPAGMETLSLLGPFGQVAFEEQTRYWTVAERNLQVPAFNATLLYNRLLWIGIGVLALVVARLRFSFRLHKSGAASSRSAGLEPPVPANFSRTPASGAGVVWRQFLSQTRMDVRGITRSAPFYVLLAFGMFNVVGGYIGALSGLYGTPTYPVTSVMTQVVGSNFSFVVLLIVIYYAGELVHREREARVAQIVDATPFPAGTMVAAKVVALWFVITALFLVVICAGMILQAVNGYSRFEPGLYVTDVIGVLGGSFYFWAVLAVFFQVLSPGKFVGMLALLLFFLASGTLDGFGYEHLLYAFSLPAMPYSPMNGYGHFLPRFFTVAGYLAAMGVLLGVGAHLFYPRGMQSYRERWAGAALRFTPAVRQLSVLAAVVLFALGGFIYYNTNVLNSYQNSEARQQEQADYERNYRRYIDSPLPDLHSLAIEVDLVPEERALESRGLAVFVNDTGASIAEVPLSLAPVLAINSLTIEGATRSFADEQLGFYRYTFIEPLAPGASAEMTWDLSWSHEGFVNSNSNTRLVHNGTFVNNTEIMPLPGYDPSRELQDNNVRRENDLPAVIRLPKLEEKHRRSRSIFGGRRTEFRAIVSTAPDQTAIAPGYLQREWQAGGRRYFEYVMDEPIWPYVSIVSARYEQASDVWRNPTGDDVELAVFYDKQHEFNVQRMFDSSKASLDYFSTEFSPYQYRQFRILEFPGYETFAQSFPNTIPYSERIGFIADLRDPAEIDYVFYVTAHELAHQWWGHQVAAAPVQGETLLIETLAQYSALMVMEREYGAATMRRFLRYELDSYLAARGGELVEELPLLRVENQGYIHYRKGSLAMYALKDAIGEEAVNAALRRLLARYAFNEEDYPTSLDLIAELRAAAGPEQQQLITDLFEKIVLFELQVTDVVVRPVEAEFEVSVTVNARKFEADGAGEQREVPLDYELDLGLFAEPTAAEQKRLSEVDLPVPLWIEKRRVVSGEQTFVVRTAERPARVGIDPYNKMIDRNPDDNLRQLN